MSSLIVEPLTQAMLLLAFDGCSGTLQMGLPGFPYSQRMASGASLPGGNDADVSDGDDSPDDASFSSEEGRTWGPPEEAARSDESHHGRAKRLAQAAAALPATAARASKTAAAAAKPAPAKPAAPKPANSKLGFKAGFLTGGQLGMEILSVLMPGQGPLLFHNIAILKQSLRSSTMQGRQKRNFL